MDRLYFLIWIAAIWVAVIPLVGKYIITFFLVVLTMILPGNLLISGTALSSLIIFSFPLVIFGMVSPYLVKLGVKDIINNGKITGEIYALSTIGSIIGTFIPTFVTIPTIGTSKTFFVFALILNLICLFYFIITRAKVLRTLISSILILLFILIPFNNSYAFWKKDIIYEGESSYNYLQVSKDSDSEILSTNVAFGIQSIYKKNQALSGLYYDYALMAPLFEKNTDFSKKLDSLILGLGTGTYAKEMKHFFVNTNTDGVEIDKKIADLSKKYFDLKDDKLMM
jgi:predicted membrane-bound spermidine synthase